MNTHCIGHHLCSHIAKSSECPGVQWDHLGCGALLLLQLGGGGGGQPPGKVRSSQVATVPAACLPDTLEERRKGGRWHCAFCRNCRHTTDIARGTHGAALVRSCARACVLCVWMHQEAACVGIPWVSFTLLVSPLRHLVQHPHSLVNAVK